MGWIIFLLIIVIILVISFSGRKQVTKRTSSQTTEPKIPPVIEPIQSGIRELLELGYRNKMRLTIKYETGNPKPGEPAIKIRSIDIFGLGDKYFDAYCHYRCAQRTFKISRVLSAHLSGETYQIPSDYFPSGWVTQGWGEIRDD